MSARGIVEVVNKATGVVFSPYVPTSFIAVVATLDIFSRKHAQRQNWKRAPADGLGCYHHANTVPSTPLYP